MSSSAASSCTSCPKGSIASATTACSPDHPVPTTSRAPATYSLCPRLKTTMPRLTPSIPASRQPPHIPARAEPPPRYNTIDFGSINRLDGPEDGALADRCLTGGLPEFGTPFGGSFRRIVQTPSGISMFYDVGQGQGWQRNIVMNGSPHLPLNIRQWYGDSRGHWEGNTLVIDVTNFSPKTDYYGSRENLHVVERWTRTGPTSLEYVVTIEDPTVWTRPWSVKQDFTRQSDQENRVYYEPRCVEGNYGLPGMLHGRRMQERAVAEGRGPDPATSDNISGGFILEEDPLR